VRSAAAASFGSGAWRGTRRTVLSALAGGLWSVSQAIAAARDTALDDAIAAMDRYLAGYRSRLSALVADEWYEQQITSFGRKLTRILQSEFIFARPPDGAPWTGFRDTLSIDGRPIADRDLRLRELLADGSDDALERAQRIAEENARYNLDDGLAYRTINTPTLTLEFFDPHHRSRLTFRRRGEETIDRQRVLKIDFVEQPSLIIRTPAGDSQKTRGSVWIDPQSGAIVRTYLNVVITDDHEARIAVEYRPDAKLAIPAPVEMRESYRPHVEGHARYTNFRTFETAGRVLDK
jgi:hypothetical protein